MKKTGLFLILFSLCFCSLHAQTAIMGPRNSLGPVVVAGSAVAERVVTLGGRLEPRRKISHAVPVAGYVDAILVTQGQRVRSGQNLLQVSRGVVGESFRPVFLEARLSGIVSEILVYETEEVSANTQAVVIIDDSSYLLRASLSDRDAQAVMTMNNRDITGTSTEGITLDGRVLQLSPEPDYATGLYTLSMEFTKKPESFLGMVLFVDLPVGGGGGVPVDQTAIFTADGSRWLWVIDKDSRLVRREVETGRELANQILIQEGIAPGERYLRVARGNEREGMELRELLQSSLGGQTGRTGPNGGG